MGGLQTWFSNQLWQAFAEINVCVKFEENLSNTLSARAWIHKCICKVLKICWVWILLWLLVGWIAHFPMAVCLKWNGKCLY